ncbi:MAG: hypothetical protein K6A30_00455 [Lachnospiraceae bacterium]|nr:hypothetical protein [Lachnospiraceae bacterium]
MENRLLDYSKFCVEGTELLDGQKISGLNSYVSYGVLIHENVDVAKLNECVKSLYREIDCFHMHLVQDENGFAYGFDPNIGEEVHLLKAEGEKPEEKLRFAKNHVLKQSSWVRDRFSYSPFFVELFEIEPEEYFLAAYLDRYVSDGHSIGVALMKLLGAYRDTVIEGGVSTKSMMDYMRSLDTEQHREKARQDALYWKEHLKGFALLPYEKKSDTRAFEDENVCVYLPKQEIVTKARALRSTLGNLLMAAYHLTIYEVFGKEDNVISYVSTDRNTLEQWGIIGPFLKPLSSRVTVEKNLSVKDFIKKVAKESGENLRHKDAAIQDIPLSRYGMLFLNHSKPFLTDPVFTQWMPGLYLDEVEGAFFYLRMQELAQEIEVTFVCNRERICKEDYEKVVDCFLNDIKKLCNHPQDELSSILKEEE